MIKEKEKMRAKTAKPTPLYGDRNSRAKYVVSGIVFGLLGVIMVVYVISLLIPLLWTIMSSLNDSYGFSMRPFAFPKELHWDNFAYAFKQLEVEIWVFTTQKLIKYSYLNMFLYSVIYAAGITIVGLVMNFICAYPIAKYKFFGRKFLYNLTIVMMIVPVVGTLPANLYVRRVLGIYDNIWLYILTTPGGFTFNFLLLYGFIKGLSWNYAESAFIDGASDFRVMVSIYLPMCMPLLTGLFLLGFVGSWNDYTTIITYLPSTPNLAYGVYIFDQYAVVKRHTEPQVLAAFLLLAVPTAAFWVFAQRFALRSVVIGGLKE